MIKYYIVFFFNMNIYLFLYTVCLLFQIYIILFFFLLICSGKEDDLYGQLKQVKNITVYKKKDIPNHYHYKNNRRVMPIIIEADPNFLICHTKEECVSAKGLSILMYFNDISLRYLCTFINK